VLRSIASDERSLIRAILAISELEIVGPDAGVEADIGLIPSRIGDDPDLPLRSRHGSDRRARRRPAPSLIPCSRAGRTRRSPSLSPEAMLAKSKVSRGDQMDLHLHPNRIVLVNPVLQASRKRRRLPAIDLQRKSPISGGTNLTRYDALH
jgi:hypothetical protein